MLKDLGWLKIVKLRNIAGDIINPATNEKLDSSEAKLQAILDKLNEVKTQYKSDIVEVGSEEHIIDLGGFYTEFVVVNDGKEEVLIKLNTPTNDEIKLSGGSKGIDAIGSDSFGLIKIYHKTAEAGKVSKLFYFVMK